MAKIFCIPVADQRKERKHTLKNSRRKNSKQVMSQRCSYNQHQGMQWRHIQENSRIFLIIQGGNYYSPWAIDLVLRDWFSRWYVYPLWRRGATWYGNRAFFHSTLQLWLSLSFGTLSLIFSNWLELAKRGGALCCVMNLMLQQPRPGLFPRDLLSSIY